MKQNFRAKQIVLLPLTAFLFITSCKLEKTGSTVGPGYIPAPGQIELGYTIVDVQNSTTDSIKINNRILNITVGSKQQVLFKIGYFTENINSSFYFTTFTEPMLRRRVSFEVTPPDVNNYHPYRNGIIALSEPLEGIINAISLQDSIVTILSVNTLDP